MISPKFLSLALLITPLVGVTTPLSANAGSPTPGTGSTNANLLSEKATQSPDATVSSGEAVAQVERRRRPPSVRREAFKPNYIGVGVNLGIDGNTALGNTEFAVNSRIKLTPELSFRPGAIIGNNAAILVPVTYDFTATDVTIGERSFSLTPYIGGGIFFTTDDESEDDLGGLLTAGVDIPISRQLTANAGLNVGFENDTEWGILVGVGYNLPRN